MPLSTAPACRSPRRRRRDGTAREKTAGPRREVKPGVFFTQDKLDGKGYPVRDRDSSSYIATF